MYVIVVYKIRVVVVTFMHPSTLLVCLAVCLLTHQQYVDAQTDCIQYETYGATLWRYETAAAISNCSCSWGQYFNYTDRGCYECPSFDDVAYTWMPTVLTIVDGDANDKMLCEPIRTCAEGYYNQPWPGRVWTCLKSIVEGAACPKGFAASRYNATDCRPCNFPQLIDAWEYAESAMPPSCSLSPRASGGCVLYQSPAWDKLVCRVACISGYTHVNYWDSTLIPDCQPCVVDCGPGKYKFPPSKSMISRQSDIFEQDNTPRHVWRKDRGTGVNCVQTSSSPTPITREGAYLSVK